MTTGATPINPARIANPQRILVIRGGAIGDFVLTLPALRALRTTFPQAWIVLMGYAEIAELAHRRFYADAVWRVDAADIAPLFAPDGRLGEEAAMRLRGFDLAVCFWMDASSTLTTNLRKLGIAEVVSVNPFPPEGERIHAARHMLNSIGHIVGPGHDSVPRIFLSDVDKAFGISVLQTKIQEPKSKIICAVHPGSGGRRKLWPASRFAALMEKTAHELGICWLLSCGPADGQVCEAVCANLTALQPIRIENLTLVQLASVLSQCRAYVGNDSGITHLAAAVGTPVVAVFGPTDPVIWGPLGERVRIITSTSSSDPWPSVGSVFEALTLLLDTS